jgi:hypothetical protein
MNNLFSLILPVAAEASKHGAHHETKVSHLLREQFSLELPVTTEASKHGAGWRLP